MAFNTHMKRAIQQKIENPLAQKILAGEYSSGENAYLFG